MNSQILKLVLLASLILTAACDLTLKRKSKKSTDAQTTMSEKKNKSDISVSAKTQDKKNALISEAVFSDIDKSIIVSFYSDKSNSVIRENMIRHTNLSQKQQKELIKGKIIPRGFQVIPLPLKLERALSRLGLHILRVQVGANVVLMNVKSRQILDIIKI